MNTIVKTLEQIGQTTSLKQHSSIVEMLDTLKISKNLIKHIENSKQEYICGLVPEDDGEGEGEEE